MSIKSACFTLAPECSQPHPKHIVLFSVLLSVFATSLAAQNVAIVGGPQGLTSLRYSGQEVLNDGSFRVNQVNFSNGSQGDLQGSSTFDASRFQLQKVFNWGRVTVGYTQAANRLSLNISVTNNTPYRMDAIYLEPLSIRMPQKTLEYNDSSPILADNLGGPSVLRLTSGSTSVVLANDDITRPLRIGFPWALNRPVSTIFPIRVNTGRENMYPDFLPIITRPIEAGATDVYRLSLRFGSSDVSTGTLAADVYQSYVSAFPSTLQWTDRRPIGSLILATAATGWTTNPRGWFLDPSINVTTPAGLAAFRTRVLAWADNSVNVLKKMNAQGAITWDIEGEQFPHATTYVGDPRLFATLAPEMANVADEYFKRFRDAGLKVGVCVRPQQFVLSGDGRSANQNEVADPAQILIDKITYAKVRWGATLIYIDSNGSPNAPLDASVFRRVAQAHPDVLLIPEHQNLAYYGITAPYEELRQGSTKTPADIASVYASAFTVINTSDSALDPYWSGLAAGVRRGDVLMFRGWWDDPILARVKELYTSNAPSTPITPAPPPVVIPPPVVVPPFAPVPVAPPAIAFQSIGGGSVFTTDATISVNASSSIGIAGVRFLIDGQSIGQELSSGPYSVVLRVASYSDGTHTLTAMARDNAGTTSSTNVVISIAKPILDLTPPTVSISIPNGGILSGVVILSALASDAGGVAGVQFQIDRSSMGAELKSAPYSLSLDTLKLSNGSHLASVIARDNSGNVASTEIPFTVINSVTDNVPPSITVVSPTNNSTVSQTTVLQSIASDNIGVASIRYTLDGVDIGRSSSPSLIFDSTGITGGLHYLTATAQDIAGNSSSNTVSFSVSNSQAPGCGTVGVRAFVGCYYSQTDLTSPAFTRLDPELGFDWGTASPSPLLRANNFSVTWQGKFSFDGGTYAFEIRPSGGFRLYVDDQVVFSQWPALTGASTNIRLPVAPGTHAVRVDYANISSNPVLKLNWSRQ